MSLTLLGDCVINDVSLRYLHNEELEERQFRMEEFEELHGKKEHNVCIFDGNYETECEVIIPINSLTHSYNHLDCLLGPH
jgi:hypothetical protein